MTRWVNTDDQIDISGGDQIVPYITCDQIGLEKWLEKSTNWVTYDQIRRWPNWVTKLGRVYGRPDWVTRLELWPDCVTRLGPIWSLCRQSGHGSSPVWVVIHWSTASGVLPMNRLRSVARTSGCWRWRCWSSSVARWILVVCLDSVSLPWMAVFLVSHIRKNSFQMVVIIVVVQMSPVLEFAVHWMWQRYTSWRWAHSLDMRPSSEGSISQVTIY